MTGLNTRVAVARLNMRVAVTRQNMPVVLPWVLMSHCISSETIILDGVLPPITVDSFPPAEMFHPL